MTGLRYSPMFTALCVLSLLGCSSGEETNEPSGSNDNPNTGDMPGSGGVSTGGDDVGSGGAGMSSGGSGAGTGGVDVGSGGGDPGTGGSNPASGGSNAGTGGGSNDPGCGALEGYQLLWEDHFDGDSLNTEYWNIEDGGGSNWNNTAVDDPRVVEVSDGTLKLKAIKNPDFGPNLSTISLNQTLDDTYVWTGAVDTQRKVDFLYGRVEIKARLEARPRAWPAIWMMPTESVYGGNPDSGEIDIVERLNLDDFYYSTVHTFYHSSNKSDPERYTTESADTIDQWTLFEVEWTEDKIEFFRDGNSYHVVNRSSNATNPEWHRWPFKEDFYIILSQQVGGGWVDGGASRPLEDADVPFQMEVDYVRVCQRTP